MKKNFRFILLFVMVMFSVGCSSTVQYVPLPDQTTRIEDPEKARIYVIRPTSFGAAVPIHVKDNGELIGKTGPKGYLSWERDPGTMKLVSKAENKAELPLNVKKGAVYYIQQHIRMGVLYARNKLRLMTEEEGEKKLKKAKPPKVQLK